MRGEAFLGLDLGTSGCRAVAIDGDGKVLASARRALPPSHRPFDGASEQNPHDWWHATRVVLRELTGQLDARPRALCIDATSASLLLCTADGRPLTPALMYDDRRATQAAAHIARVAPDTAAVHGPSSALAKFLHLRAQPVADTWRALHQADWVLGRLRGRYTHSDENNCLKLGYDPVQRRWPEWLDALDIDRATLPQVVPVASPLGPIAPVCADELHLPHDLLLVAGTTDSNAATLAAGAGETGDAVTSLGSTLVIKVVSATPVAAPQYGIYSHRMGDHWLAGRASNSGGAVLSEFFSPAELTSLSHQLDPDHPTGLAYYPLVRPGERFPYNDPHKPPRLQPRPDDPRRFLQGILEGIATIEERGYRLLEELGAPFPTRVWSAGGGAANAAWTEIRQRLLQVPVIPARHHEAAYGSARLAHAGYLGLAPLH